MLCCCAPAISSAGAYTDQEFNKSRPAALVNEAHATGCPAQSVSKQPIISFAPRQPFRCPYYRFAKSDIYGRLSDVTDYDESYYDRLATMSGASAANAKATRLLKVRVITWRRCPWKQQCLFWDGGTYQWPGPRLQLHLLLTCQVLFRP